MSFPSLTGLCRPLLERIKNGDQVEPSKLTDSPELITDGRPESEARSLLKKPDFLFGDSIDEDAELMLSLIHI